MSIESIDTTFYDLFGIMTLEQYDDREVQVFIKRESLKVGEKLIMN